MAGDLGCGVGHHPKRQTGCRVREWQEDDRGDCMQCAVAAVAFLMPEDHSAYSRHGQRRRPRPAWPFLVNVIVACRRWC